VGLLLATFAVFIGYLGFVQGDWPYVVLACCNAFVAALILRPQVESSAALRFDLL
jgi:hypothetical protein